MLPKHNHMLGLANISEVSSEMNDTSTIRPRRCRCCGQTGHDRRTCPDPSEVERRRQRRNAIAEQLRQHNHNHNQQQSNTTGGGARPRMPVRQLTERTNFKIINNNNYPMYIYWSNIGDNIIKYTHYIGESASTSIRAYPTHRLVFIPIPEIPSTTPDKIINLSISNYFIAGDFNLCEFEGNPINVIKEYKKQKTELEQWKECGLKSLFLLKELERMGATKYDNLEPLMDMVQDIELPPHTELDKEMAGVPSVFTNIT
jgi:hypothetical protein